MTARRELAEDADTFLLFCSKVRQYEVMQQIYSCKKRRKEKSLRGVFAEEGLCSERRRKEWDSSQPRKYLVHHLFSCSASIIENTENTSNCSIELWKMRQSCNSLCWPSDGGVAAESSDSLLVFAVWTYVNRRTHTFTQRVRRENNQRGKQQRQNCRREITGGRTENKQLVHGLHVDASGFTPDQQFLHDGQFFMLTELNCAVCFLQNLFKPPLISVFPSP